MPEDTGLVAKEITIGSLNIVLAKGADADSSKIFVTLGNTEDECVTPYLYEVEGVTLPVLESQLVSFVEGQLKAI